MCLHLLQHALYFLWKDFHPFISIYIYRVFVVIILQPNRFQKISIKSYTQRSIDIRREGKLVARVSAGLPDPGPSSLGSLANPVRPSGLLPGLQQHLASVFCKARTDLQLLFTLVVAVVRNPCRESRNGVVGEKRGWGLEAQVGATARSRQGAFGNWCRKRLATENWVHVPDQHSPQGGSLALSPVSLYLFSLSFLSVLFAFLLNFRNSCWEQKWVRGFTGNRRRFDWFWVGWQVFVFAEFRFFFNF